MVPIRSFGVVVDLLSESGIHVVTILLFCIIGHLQSASILGCAIQFLFQNNFGLQLRSLSVPNASANASPYPQCRYPWQSMLQTMTLY